MGLNGGFTSLFSSAGQLMVRKKGWARMSPTTPNLRLGSRSNSWKHRGGHANFKTLTNRNKIIHHLEDRLIVTDQLEQILGLLGDPSWVVGSFLPDGLEQFIFIVALEG